MIIYIKQDQADTKLCPFMSGSSDVYCKGSECMAWQWKWEHQTEFTEGGLKVVLVHKPMVPSTTEGYCGMVQR